MAVQRDAHGQPMNVSAPESVECEVCGEDATLRSSHYADQETVTHDYRCQECPASGALVEKGGERSRAVGPVFSGTNPDIRQREGVGPPDGPERSSQPVGSSERAQGWLSGSW